MEERLLCEEYAVDGGEICSGDGVLEGKGDKVV